MFRKVVYATYEQLGMAKLKWQKDKNSYKFTIISYHHLKDVCLKLGGI